MQSNNKLIAFIGLFFLASISLHAFAHIDDNLIEAKSLIECQSCQNEISSDIELFSYTTHEFQRELTRTEISQIHYPELNKPFNSQAPPKI
jgi:hypothetical protein